MWLNHNRVCVLFPVPLLPKNKYPRPSLRITEACISNVAYGAEAKAYTNMRALIQSELTPGIALCHQSGPTIRKIGVSLQ